jgi:threonine dehydrogenase-like Zn-dependent dehydrogenase
MLKSNSQRRFWFALRLQTSADLILHMYECRTDVENGKFLGHENLGKALEVGKAVRQVKVGIGFACPFNVSCGFCKNCERAVNAV